MGRKLLDWRTLKDRGCKPHRWMRRKQEQETKAAKLLANPDVAAFLQSAREEHATFSKRCHAGISVCAMIGGGPFTWDEDNFLTDARNVATKIVADADYQWRGTQKVCQEFLDHLDHGASKNIFLDPVACKTAELALIAFAKPDFTEWYLLLLDLAQYFGTKHADGSYFFTRKDMNDEEWLGDIFDQSSEVLQIAGLPIR